MAQRRLCRALLVLCVVSGTGAAAAAAADWDAIQPPNIAAMLSDPAYVRSEQQAQQDYLSAQAEQSTPQQAQDRDASATAFDDLTGTSAQQLAQQRFPDLMTGDLDALQLPDGARVERYLSPDVARIVNDEGKRSLIVGSEPLAAEDASGDLHRVDLTLQSEGDHYVAANPAADVQIAQRADDYTSVSDGGLGVRPGDAPDTAGLQQDDRVFYPEVATDTDYVSMPTRRGVELMWQLRSEQASSSLPLDLDLPDGASVRLTSTLTAPIGATVGASGAGAEIVRDGTVVDTITAPVAMDADGTPVAAAYRLDGDQLVVDVDHQGKDLKYPIAVDPVVQEVWGGTDFNNGCNTPGSGNWHYQTFVTALDAYCNNGTTGLYVQSGPNIFYGDGAAGQWWWGTPAYVHIVRAWLDGLFHVPQATTFYDGIYQNDHGWETVHNFTGGMQNAQDTVVQNPGWDTNFVVFGMRMNGAGYRGGYGLAAIRGANVQITEGTPPTFVKLDRTVPSIENYTWAGNKASPWINGRATVTAQVSAQDVGLGMYHIGIDQTSGGDYLFDAFANCNGTRGAPCSLGMVQSGTLNFRQLKGLITLRTFASDITDNLVHGPQWVERIDRDDPWVELSGAVVAHRDDHALGAGDALHVKITDGTDRAGDSGFQSGVRSVRVTLDGNRFLDWTNANPDATNNNFERDLPLPAGLDGSITHTIVVRATDDARNDPGTAEVRFTTGFGPAYPEDPDRDPGNSSPVAPGAYGVVGTPDPCADGPCDTDPVATEASHPSLVWGIHDQNLAGLGAFAITDTDPCSTNHAGPDPRFLALLRSSTQGGVSSARYVVPYDVAVNVSPSWCGRTIEQRNLEQWLNDVRALGLEPLISFEHISYHTDGYNSDTNNPLPTDDEYTRAIVAFLNRYQTAYNLRYFTAWNEPNGSNQPTGRTHSKPANWAGTNPPATTTEFGAAMAGRYWRILRRACRCTVAAGDLVDSRDLRFTNDWYATYNRYLLRTPTVWALHTYGGMFSGRIDTLRAFKTATAAGSPNIWITETGPRFGWDTPSPPDANVVQRNYRIWMDAFAAISSRVTRFYMYQFQGDPRWDTGLIPLPGGDPSSALTAARNDVICDYKVRVGAGTC